MNDHEHGDEAIVSFESSVSAFRLKFPIIYNPILLIGVMSIALWALILWGIVFVWR